MTPKPFIPTIATEEAAVNEPCMVDWCNLPVGDGYVCQKCSRKLEIALGDVGALWEQLDIVLTRQARYSDAQGRGGDKALPFNPEASEIGWVLRNTLTTWCRLIAEERGWDLPEDEPAKIAGWILHHMTWLRGQEAGHLAIEEITSAVNAVRRAVDRPAERLYAGPCKECGTDLYGKPGATSLTCKACEATLTLDSQLEWMDAVLADKLVTAREGVVLLARYGIEVPQGTVKKWHQRKLLEDCGPDPQGAWLYRWPDLKFLAKIQTAEREEAS